MKTRLLSLLSLSVMFLGLVGGLFPTTTAFASNDGDSKFYGTVEDLPAGGLFGDWRVSGRTVHVSSATLIKQKYGPVAVGAYVKVEGWLQADGSVNATKIEVKRSAGGGGSYFKFYGTVESLPANGLIGDWRVSGRTVHVTAGTWIKQEKALAAVGAYVEVTGTQQADGSVNATKIEVKRSSVGGGGQSYLKFYGTVQSLPAGGLIGDWVVSGRTVHVTAATLIKQKYGSVRVGAYVEVKGTQQADGSVNAIQIETKR